MKTGKFACHCCGFKTFDEMPGGHYEICEVCFWEDDPIQMENPDYEGGANAVSLRQGQKNFLEFGSCERKSTTWVRKPHINEHRDENWEPLK